MSERDVPAGQAGGLSNVSEAPELPERLRVHALAKLIEVTSRQVLDALEELGAPAKGAQSSIERATALRVIESLAPSGAPDAPAAPAVGAFGIGAFEVGDPAGGVSREVIPPTNPVPAALALSNPEPDIAGGAGPDGPGGALPLFAAPSPMFLPPEPPARPRTAAPAPALSSDDAEDTDDGEDADSAEDSADTKRRRRRGRRGRGRGKGSDDESVDGEDDERRPEDDSADRADGSDDTDSESDQDDDESGEDAGAESDGDDSDDEASEESGGSSRRRRRRRRRRDPSDSDGETESEDPPNTVTRIRETRPARPDRSERSESGDEHIQGVRGSTRLEAKRQRRRDGRDAGRRRAPVLSEAEFLARRESVERTMVVRQHGERSEIGVLEDGVLVEHFVTSSGGSSLVGNVYLGRVQNVLPSMEAAFVDIGRGRNAVLYAGEVDWDAAGLAGKARRIEQALSSGDSILVQVTKDPIGHKGARLTTQISLPGRFLVYVPSGGTHGISRKLPDTERRRLKDLLKEIVPDDAGVIIRTASEGVSQEALERDVRRLQAQWDVVKTKSEAAAKSSGKSKPPELLYEEPDLMIKVVRDQFNEDFAKLVVQGDDAWDTLHAYVSHVAPELTERLGRHVGTSDAFSEYRIDEQLMKALDRKVWLPSGGTLVIDRTEAMTVIDVNTGKFTGSGGNLEETVTRNNLEAAEEIVRQLRLRDIGGIIVIDFIDMVLESNRDLVLRRLTECLGRDRTRHQVAEVTSLGLVQMTRKRVGVGLLEAFSTPCEHCRGRGVVVSTDPVEPKGDQGQQQNAGSGTRRRGGRGDNRPGDGRPADNRSGGDNRGGDNRSGDGRSGGDNRGSDNRSDNRGSDSRGGDHGDGNGNGNGNNGHSRRNRGGHGGSGGHVGGPADVANGHDRGTAEPGVPNGRPVPGAPTREPEHAEHSEPAQPARPTTEPVGASAPTDAGHATEQSRPAAASEAFEAPAQAAPAGVADVTGPPPSSIELSVPTEPSLVPDNASSAIDTNSVSTEEERADQADQHEDWEPISIGATPERAARPARRRRRVASRPAGPPAGGEGSPDPV
ncbi:MAG TPA: Rne/Rng family ribonuclease [Pseudonocardia sp.]|nr:Rne/Rng family ribonuclease [Pseudonocardia sp.]